MNGKQEKDIRLLSPFHPSLSQLAAHTLSHTVKLKRGQLFRPWLFASLGTSINNISGSSGIGIGCSIRPRHTYTHTLLPYCFILHWCRTPQGTVVVLLFAQWLTGWLSDWVPPWVTSGCTSANQHSLSSSLLSSPLSPPSQIFSSDFFVPPHPSCLSAVLPFCWQFKPPTKSPRSLNTHRFVCRPCASMHLAYWQTNCWCWSRPVTVTVTACWSSTMNTNAREWPWKGCEWGHQLNKTKCVCVCVWPNPANWQNAAVNCATAAECSVVWVILVCTITSSLVINLEVLLKGEKGCGEREGEGKKFFFRQRKERVEALQSVVAFIWQCRQLVNCWTLLTELSLITSPSLAHVRLTFEEVAPLTAKTVDMPQIHYSRQPKFNPHIDWCSFCAVSATQCSLQFDKQRQSLAFFTKLVWQKASIFCWKFDTNG